MMRSRGSWPRSSPSSRSIVHRREPTRRRRQHRHRPGGQGQARWLHAAADGQQRAGHQPLALQDTGFDPIKDFEPITPVATAGYVLVANTRSCRRTSRTDRPREGPARKARDRVRRKRHAESSDRRNAAAGGRDRDAARALPGRCGRRDRPRCRPGAGVGPEPAVVDLVHQGGQAQGAGRGQREARVGAAGCADHRRDDQRFRLDAVVRDFAPAGTPKAIVARLQGDTAKAVDGEDRRSSWPAWGASLSKARRISLPR